MNFLEHVLTPDRTLIEEFMDFSEEIRRLTNVQYKGVI